MITGPPESELVTIGSTTLVNGLEGVTNRSDGINVTRDASGNLLELRNGNGTTSANSAYTLDGLGSTIALTDSTGTTDTALYTYQPYGATASSSGTLATTNPFRYTSGYQLTAPSMYHFGDRYYNQGLNRWTQRDSIAGSISSPSDVNRYVYGSDNPANKTDLSGQFSWGDVTGALEGVGHSLDFLDFAHTYWSALNGDIPGTLGGLAGEAASLGTGAICGGLLASAAVDGPVGLLGGAICFVGALAAGAAASRTVEQSVG